MVVNQECYFVHCYHWTLCDKVPYHGSSLFSSEISLVHRAPVNSSISRNNKKLNKSPRVNSTKTASKALSTDRLATNKHPSNPLVHGKDFSEKSKTNHKNDEVSKAAKVQRKELRCRGVTRSRVSKSALGRGSWVLSGKTNSSWRCVELCCAQRGCDVALQIGEFCYALACYKDKRGCNSLAVPVGLSYLSEKKKKKKKEMEEKKKKKEKEEKKKKEKMEEEKKKKEKEEKKKKKKKKKKKEKMEDKKEKEVVPENEHAPNWNTSENPKNDTRMNINNSKHSEDFKLTKNATISSRNTTASTSRGDLRNEKSIGERPFVIPSNLSSVSKNVDRVSELESGKDVQSHSQKDGPIFSENEGDLFKNMTKGGNVGGIVQKSPSGRQSISNSVVNENDPSNGGEKGHDYLVERKYDLLVIVVDWLKGNTIC